MAKLTKLEKACGASGLTIKDACDVIGVSSPTFISYKKNPLLMTFDQYFELARHMDRDAQGLMVGVLADAEASAATWKPLGELTLGEYYAAKKSVGKLEGELALMKQRTFG